jgi:hypothetical protein
MPSCHDAAARHATFLYQGLFDSEATRVVREIATTNQLIV